MTATLAGERVLVAGDSGGRQLKPLRVRIRRRRRTRCTRSSPARRRTAQHRLKIGVNDQVAGIGAVVVTGTVRDSLHILDTILNLDGGPRPDATDTASYSDTVFGLFLLLGYRFSPRIADIADQRFW